MNLEGDLACMTAEERERVLGAYVASIGAQRRPHAYVRLFWREFLSTLLVCALFVGGAASLVFVVVRWT